MYNSTQFGATIAIKSFLVFSPVHYWSLEQAGTSPAAEVVMTPECGLLSRSAAAKVSVASSGVPVVARGTGVVISEGTWRGGGSVRNKRLYYKQQASF